MEFEIRKIEMEQNEKDTVIAILVIGVTNPQGRNPVSPFFALFAVLCVLSAVPFP